MKSVYFVGAIAAAALAAGCANPSRSRDLANPSVPALVMAQQVCSNCHGVTGNAVSPNFPNLAGQPEAYIVSQLSGFKNHGRRDPAGFEYMWGLSRSLTEEQIQGLASYYASQTPARQPIEGDASRIAAGKAIFEGGAPACGACHGSEGQGMATFPRIAGQHADYVVKQMLVFQRTDERPEGSVMKTVTHGLSHDDIKNVAAFVQSLPKR
ncbi:MAG: cytochrome c4 [Burkholderiales bacterium]|nr:cytochrome c4 [Burkholderiales bacterium]